MKVYIVVYSGEKEYLLFADSEEEATQKVANKFNLFSGLEAYEVLSDEGDIEEL